MNLTKLQNITPTLAEYIVSSTTRAGSGHPSSCLSSLHILNYLFNSGIMNTNWDEWSNIENDQFVLSKGHASALLFSLYYHMGLVTKKEFEAYRTFDGTLEGHPTPRSEYTHITTGSLGMGIGLGNGFAIAQKMKKHPSKTYVLCGDSELAEGSNWESIQIAAHKNLSNLVVLVDVNRLGQRGETMDGWDIERLGKKFHAFGFHTIVCEDGHDYELIDQSFKAISNDKPSAILFKTIKGWGNTTLENKNGWHGKILPAVS